MKITKRTQKMRVIQRTQDEAEKTTSHQPLTTSHGGLSLAPGGRRTPDHRQRDLRRMLLRMTHHVMRHHTLDLVVRIPAGIEIPVEAREITAGYLDPNPMLGREVVACGHGLQRHLVRLARPQPRG